MINRIWNNLVIIFWFTFVLNDNIYNLELWLSSANLCFKHCPNSILDSLNVDLVQCDIVPVNGDHYIQGVPEVSGEVEPGLQDAAGSAVLILRGDHHGGLVREVRDVLVRVEEQEGAGPVVRTVDISPGLATLTGGQDPVQTILALVLPPAGVRVKTTECRTERLV